MAHPRHRLGNADPRDNPELNRTYLSLPAIEPAPPGLAQAADAPASQDAYSTQERGAALSREPSLSGSRARSHDPAQ